MKKPFRVLCVGGSDSGGGAGIQADLKAVTASGCYGTSVIAALTAQNTIGVQGIFPVPRTFIAAQMDSVLSDIGADAVKTGMLLTESAVRVVAEKILEYHIKKVVVDPVMIAKGGRAIMRPQARKAIVERLLPLASAVTPNIPEAEVLTGMRIQSAADMRRAACVIAKTGVRNVVIKGGHLPERRRKISLDILYDGKTYHEFQATWIPTKNSHGTGCTFASALAAFLAIGYPVVDAVRQAKTLVTKAIANGLPIGKGHGSVHALSTTMWTAQKQACLIDLQKAIFKFMSAPLGRLIPEVSSNLVYAKPKAKTEKDVAGFPGRIIRVRDEIRVVSGPAFGASEHMAHVVLTVMRHYPECRCAMNIRYSKELVEICGKIGFAVSCFSRSDEPADRQSQDGCTLEWGVHHVLMRSERVPDVIYDTGGWGKEPMIRILGKNPEDVAGKVLKLMKHLS
jgi:hydroxymethylpyrimidine/phosphomethylpyrimidine kinase